VKIPATKVAITRVYLVDCAVCGEQVVTESADWDSPAAYRKRGLAEEAKREHLAQHESGYFE
jgi:hypothetical protein